MSDETNFAVPTLLNASDEDQQWIQIFPSGVFYGVDGRGPYRVSNPENMIAASRREKTDLVIDRDHQRFYAPKGTVIPAAGWIKDFEVREAGEIWALVEWTPAAKADLKSKEFRYFSPEYAVHKVTREILRITGGTLTNDPNFELAAVASADRTHHPKKETSNMNEFLKKMAKTLGLPETATQEQIEAAAADREAKLATLNKERVEAATALGLKDGESFGDVIKEAASRQNKIDPSAYVPMQTYKETASQLRDLQNEIRKDKANVAVEAAMKDGKIAPAMKSWALDYASNNPEGFAEFVKNQPQVVGSEVASRASEKREDGLDEVEREVASRLNLSPEQYLGKAKTEAKTA